MMVEYFCSARQKEKRPTTKGFSTPGTHSPSKTASYIKNYMYIGLSLMKGFCRLTIFCFHRMINRPAVHLVHMLQKALGNSLLWQFTDCRICLPGCSLKDAEEPTLVQTAHFWNIAFSSIASSITHYVSVQYVSSNKNSNWTL